MVQAMRHGLLPATLHIDEPTPHVDWSSGTVRLLTEPAPWPETGRPRRAGVSGFGIGGTNAHLILEEAPEADETPEGQGDATSGALPWLISARSEQALRAQAAALADHLAGHPDLTPGAVGWSLLKTRTTFEHRAAITGDDRRSMTEALHALAGGRPHADLVNPGTPAITTHPGPVFVFPGQGSQWTGMATDLLGTSPVFAQAMDECQEALAPYIDWTLTDALHNTENQLDRVDVVQPVLWATMVSLAKLWMHHGVTPAAVVGHSQGEIAAAHIAGALSLEEAAKISALRSRALRRLAGLGAMASIGASADDTERLLEKAPDVTVAAVNSPTSTVISGPPDQVRAVVDAAEGQDLHARMIGVDYASHGPQIDQITGELTDALVGITPATGDIAFYSTVTGQQTDTLTLDTNYWITNLRQPVRFADTITALLGDGHRVFIETSPHPVLTLGVQQTIDAGGTDAVTVPTLRRDHGDHHQFTQAAATAHAHGTTIDWTGWYPGARPAVPLPTYAFQRQRYWPGLPSARSGDPGELGMAPAAHPLLGAVVELADAGMYLLTGRLSAQSREWLSGHRVMGTVLLPGTALAEFALYAAAEVGCDHVAELIMHEPLVLPDDGTVDLQVAVAAPDESGRRPVSVHSRASDEAGESGWTKHASGLLAVTASPPAAEPAPVAWPPPDATEIPVRHGEEDLDGDVTHEAAAETLTAAWAREGHVYAEVALPEQERAEAAGYGVHPLLLDAALKACSLAAEGDQAIMLPFSWSGLRLHASGATALRVHVSVTAPDRISLTATDRAGEPVVTLDDVTLRPVNVERLEQAGATSRNALFQLGWTPQAASATGPAPRPAVIAAEPDALAAALVAALPDTEVHPDVAALRAAGEIPEFVLGLVPGEPGTDPVTRLRDVGAAVLTLVQDWLADPGLTDGKLVVVTRGAVATHGEEVIGDPAASAAWGLVRSVQSENPGRLVLLDLDEHDISLRAVPAALATGEAQLALRDGRPYVPRLTHNEATERAEPIALDPAGTVLVTGNMGALAGIAARHMVTRYGARRLLLTSRRGPEAPEAAELAAELIGLGAEVEVAACDVGDRAALADLLAAVPGDRPLTAVVHTAAVVRDATILTATREQLDEVLHAKADPAWHLHELTRDLDLAAFVLFSSAAGLIGGAGQGSYAAANTFLDTLAQYRHTAGLPATSLAWGFWDLTTGMSGRLTDTDRARNARSGHLGLTIDQGLGLFDAALATDEPLLVPIRLDLARMRRQARAENTPTVLRKLVPPAAPQAGGAAAPGMAKELRAMPAADRERALLDVVRGHAAAVLGHDDATTVAPERRFRDLGFDSLTSVELRNRLTTITGLRLPATLIFDQPTPTAVARFLGERIAAEAPAPSTPLLADLDRFEAALGAIADQEEQAKVAARLRELLRDIEGRNGAGGGEPDETGEALESATDDELFDMLDTELTGLRDNGRGAQPEQER
jgi:acyl transferase domain-containing protein/acyl carrier protein